MKRRGLLGAAPAIGIAAFLALWEALVRLTHPKPFILRAPSAILRVIADDPGFWWRNSLTTGREALLGLIIAIAVSVAIGAPLAVSRFTERATFPILVLIQVTPFVAYAPSIVIWLGFGWKPILFLTSLVCIPLVTFGVVSGLRSVDANALELFRSVDASPVETWRRLRLPAASPALFTAARSSAGLALIVAFLGEQFSLVTTGLGVVGKKAAAFNQADPLWATVFCMALLGTIALAALGALERVVLRWHVSHRRAVRYRPQP